jgi:hypothetical protein
VTGSYWEAEGKRRKTRKGERRGLVDTTQDLFPGIRLQRRISLLGRRREREEERRMEREVSE